MAAIESVHSVETADPFQAAFVQAESSPVFGFGRSESVGEIEQAADATG